MVASTGVLGKGSKSQRMGNRVLAMDNLSWFGESSIITLCCYFVILLFCLFLLLGNIYKYITRGFCKYVLRLLRSTYTIVAPILTLGVWTRNPEKCFCPEIGLSKRGAPHPSSVLSPGQLFIFTFCTLYCSVLEILPSSLPCLTFLVLVFSLSLFLFFFLSLSFPFSCPFYLRARQPFDHLDLLR